MENPQQNQSNPQQNPNTHYLVGAKNLQDVFAYLHRTLGPEPLALINGLLGEVRGISMGANPPAQNPVPEPAKNEKVIPIPQATKPPKKK